MHPITDKAEVAIDFPDKFYMGGFGRDCSFEARAEADGVLIRLVRSEGEKRAVEIHSIISCCRASSMTWPARSPSGSRSTTPTASRCSMPRAASQRRSNAQLCPVCGVTASGLFWLNLANCESNSGFGPRVVRVGAYALSPTSRTTSLWGRLSKRVGMVAISI
jgi:hypothetical protein